jgi:hypothetical protein
MKKIGFAVLLMALLLSSCDKNVNYYDQGFQDAWKGSKNLVLYWFNKDYKQGHLEARAQMLQYKNVSDAMTRARRDMNQALDEMSGSLDRLRKNSETWGE